MPDDPDPRRDESEELTSRPDPMPEPRDKRAKRKEPGERETRPS